MPILLKDLVARVHAEIEVKVRRVRDQTRAVLQEALRTECRLMMRTPEEVEHNRQGAQVPVNVSPGYPTTLENVTFADDFEIIMLLARYRNSLEQAKNSMPRLLQLRENLLSQSKQGDWVDVTDMELRSIEKWAAFLVNRLDQHDPLKTVLAVREDWLGIYKYDTHDLFTDEYTANRATIHIYWGVIGLVMEWMGCTVEDLSIVVLTHELAHAYGLSSGSDLAKYSILQKNALKKDYFWTLERHF